MICSLVEGCIGEWRAGGDKGDHSAQRHELPNNGLLVTRYSLKKNHNSPPEVVFKL